MIRGGYVERHKRPNEAQTQAHDNDSDHPPFPLSLAVDIIGMPQSSSHLPFQDISTRKPAPRPLSAYSGDSVMQPVSWRSCPAAQKAIQLVNTWTVATIFFVVPLETSGEAE